MNHIVASIGHHGYLYMALAVFGEAIGLPIPASLVLIGAGAAAASGLVSPTTALLLAIVAMVVGDLLMFTLGRYTGWGLLAVLCRVSINPETCILRSAESFYKRGKTTLLVAKFIPGINTIAPPLAGSMKMRVLQFLRLDAAGTAFYITTYFALGFVFRDFLASITHGVLAAGRAVETVVILAVLVYL